jgi:hypothetical protein
VSAKLKILDVKDAFGKPAKETRYSACFQCLAPGTYQSSVEVKLTSQWQKVILVSTSAMQ